MKKICTYCFSFVFAVFLLTASTGISINRMVCLYSGESTYSIIPMDDCCPVEEGEETANIDEKCCDFSTIYIQTDCFIPAKPDIKLPSFSEIQYAYFFVFFFPWKSSLKSVIRLFDFSPPKPVGQFLAFLQTFLI